MPEPIAPAHERLYHDDFISHSRRQASPRRSRHARPTSSHVPWHRLGSSAGRLEPEKRPADGAEPSHRLPAETMAGPEDPTLLEASELIPGSPDRIPAVPMSLWFRRTVPSRSEPGGRLLKLAELFARTRQRITVIDWAGPTRLPIIAPLCRIARTRLGLPFPSGSKRKESKP